MLKRLAKQAFAQAGATAFLRRRNRAGLRVLMYHRFRPGFEAGLRGQCEHLARHYRPVALAETTQYPGEPRVAVTVDDGYSDFAAAWDIFRASGIPVTMFAVAGFLDRQLWLWPDVVEFCILNTRLLQISAFGRNFDLRTPVERAQADAALDALLIAAPDEERRRFIHALPTLSGVALPSPLPGEYAPLEWQDLRRMVAEGLDLGAHTVTHPLLSKLELQSTLDSEVSGAKAILQERVNAPVRCFCYPNGQADDFDARTIDAVRRAGYSAAVTAIRGLNLPGASAFELRRIGVEPEMDSAAFALEVAGYRMS